MSVICFAKEEWQKLGNSILSLQLHGNFKLNLFNEDDFRDLKSAYNWNDNKCIEQLTEWLLAKWSLANQLAYFYQYHEHKGSEKMEYHNFDFNELQGYIKHSQIYNMISSIEYNCVDNNGNDFTPEFILKKIQKIKNFLAYQEFEKDGDVK